MKKLCLVLALVGALWATSAQAALQFYNISFIDAPPGNIASGVIAVDMATGTALSGTLTVLTGSAAGTYTLLPSAGLTLSPSGAFQFDNQILGIPPGPPANPYLDLYGLAFTGTGSQTGTEVNLWGQPDGQGNAYMFWGWNGSAYVPTASGGAAISLSTVPEPTTVVAGALLLLPFAASTLRSFRKKA